MFILSGIWCVYLPLFGTLNCPFTPPIIDAAKDFVTFGLYCKTIGFMRSGQDANFPSHNVHVKVYKFAKGKEEDFAFPAFVN